MFRNVSRSAFLSVIAGSLALPFAAAPVKAETSELIFNVFIPRPAPLYKKGLEPWAREVEAASKGTLAIKIPTASLAPPKRQYDIVLDGVADISVAPLTFKRKKYSLNMISAIPLIAGSAEAGSAAAWATHKKFFADAGQWKDLVPLSFFTLGSPAILSNTKAIQSKADLKGYKVLAVGKEKIGTWKALGAVPVGGSGQKPFEVVSSGVVDGATNPLGTAVTQGLINASKHVTIVPGGMGGRATFGIFINRAKFEALPEEAQNALTSTSGATLAAKIGKIMDNFDGFGRKKFEEKGIDIQTASDELVADIAEAGGFITENWMKAAKKAGVNGEAAIAHFKSLAAK